ncbi:MAG: TraR/DksA C4-type zinc finger protein [Planctomycetota bacterium]
MITDWYCWNMDGFERPVINPGNDSVADESHANRPSEDHEPAVDEPGVELDADSSIPVVTCWHCGNRIAPERIEVFPDAKYCVTCQEIAEKNRDVVVVAPPTCPRCEQKCIHSQLVYRHARDPEIKGCFLGCSRYPHCQYIER